MRSASTANLTHTAKNHLVNVAMAVDQNILGSIVHAAKIADAHRIAAAPFARREFEHQHRSAGLARHQRGAKRSIAPADDENVGFR